MAEQKSPQRICRKHKIPVTTCYPDAALYWCPEHEHGYIWANDTVEVSEQSSAQPNTETESK